MKETPRKKILQNKSGKSCAEEIEIIDLDKLEVTYSPWMADSTERSMTLNTVVRNSAKKSSNVKCLPQLSGGSAESLWLQNIF